MNVGQIKARMQFQVKPPDKAQPNVCISKVEAWPHNHSIIILPLAWSPF